jgi:hypothetical protein
LTKRHGFRQAGAQPVDDNPRNLLCRCRGLDSKSWLVGLERLERGELRLEE